MKNLLPSAIIMLSSAVAFAQAPYKMQIELKDGSNVQYKVDDISQVTFDNSANPTFTLAYKDGQNQGYGIQVSGPDNEGIYTMTIPANAPERVIWTEGLENGIPDANYKLTFSYCSTVAIGEAKCVLFNSTMGWYDAGSGLVTSAEEPGCAWPGTPFIWYRDTQAAANEWKEISFDLSKAIASVNWNLNGKKNESIRLGFDLPAGAAAEDFTLKIKNLKLEPIE